jgi:hypothetical protein
MADARVASRADDLYMAECQTCGLRFDERTYQVIVSGIGSFDSVDCAEKALRRARRSGGADALVRPVSQLEPQVVPPPPPGSATSEDAPA